MRFRSDKFLLLGAITSIVAVAFLSGCGYSAADLCDDTCDCTGCSDAAYGDCVDDGEDLAEEADYEGCSDQYQEYMDCLGSELRCAQSRVDLDGCGSESESLNRCLK